MRKAFKSALKAAFDDQPQQGQYQPNYQQPGPPPPNPYYHGTYPQQYQQYQPYQPPQSYQPYQPHQPYQVGRSQTDYPQQQPQHQASPPYAHSLSMPNSLSHVQATLPNPHSPPPLPSRSPRPLVASPVSSISPARSPNPGDIQLQAHDYQPGFEKPNHEVARRDTLSPLPTPTLAMSTSSPGSVGPASMFPTSVGPGSTGRGTPLMSPKPQFNTMPQSVPEAADPPKIRKVLCLDGGGVRGLSEIFLLKAIMRRLSDERGFDDWRTIEPWQEFDMICGTSTGGLLAIMLGRLRMTLAECENAYENISKRIFTPSRSTANIAGRSKDFLTASGKFSAEPMESVVKVLLTERGMREDELMWDRTSDPQSPHVFVCATSSYGGPTCLRSYRNKQVDDQILPECAIWQAVRATSAASTFFPPVTIGRRTFIDGSEAGDNNPIEVAEREAREMFKDQECMFVSLGTGKGIPKDITGNLDHMIKALLKILTESERRHTRFFNQHQQWVIDNRLFRFNVTTGLGEIGLDEYKNMPLIDEFTSLYFQEEGVSTALARCAKALKEGGQRLHIIAGEDLALHFEKLQMSTTMVTLCAHCHSVVPFDTDAYFCMECSTDICQACRAVHDYNHVKWLVRFEVRAWQKKMKSHAETKTCQECLEPRKCRVQCKSCDWCLCLSCWGEQVHRNKHWLPHHTEHPQHRMLVQICPPWFRKIPAVYEECPCETAPNLANHCSCCSAILTLQQKVYWCRTCRIDFSAAAILCRSCYEAEPAEHLSSHQFQKLIYFSEQSEDDDFEKQQKRAHRCLDCNHKVIPMGALDHHPHENLAVFHGPASLEQHRMWVISTCPLRTTVNDGREPVVDAVPGPKCNYCGFGVSWGEVIGLCLWSNCVKVFCGLCLAMNRVRHRHAPMQRVCYEKNTANSFNLNAKVSCDGCGISSYRGMFTGIECVDCQNKHYCSNCLTKLTSGNLTLPNNGLHGCRSLTWKFTRY